MDLLADSSLAHPKLPISFSSEEQGDDPKVVLDGFHQFEAQTPI